MIPLGKPYIKKDIVLSELEKVLDSRWISGGPTISKFEDAIKKYNNDENGYYIAVSNGTVALDLSLLLLNDGKRYNLTDEIIVPSWSWVASGFSPFNVGATPVWCDVDSYGTPYVEDIEKRITTNTRAIIIVHQMGIPCDINKINKLSECYNIPIIEDGACAIGSEYHNCRLGKTKNIFTYSFQARKVLTTGEGGMIVVRDKNDAIWLRSMRAFGTNMSPLVRDAHNGILKESFDQIGTNAKMSDITAAMGIAHLQYLDQEIFMRSTAGNYYNSLIRKLNMNGVYDIRPANDIPKFCTRYNWQNYHVILGKRYNRDIVVDQLKQRGIGCKWDIQAIHLEPIIKKHVKSELNLSKTVKFHDHGLWLPFFAEITFEEQDEVIRNLKEILSLSIVMCK